MSASPHSSKACARALLEVVPQIMRAVRAEMRQHGAADLNVPQFRTLAFIGRRPGGSLSAVAEHIGLTLPAMSTLVNGLVARELVVRAPAADDRRRVTLTLTPRGRAVWEAAHAATAARLAEQLAALSASDREQVSRALEILRPLFAAQPADPPAA